VISQLLWRLAALDFHPICCNIQSSGSVYFFTLTIHLHTYFVGERCWNVIRTRCNMYQIGNTAHCNSWDVPTNSSTNSQMLSLLTQNITQKHCETDSLQTTRTDSDVKMSPDYFCHRNEWYVKNTDDDHHRTFFLRNLDILPVCLLIYNFVLYFTTLLHASNLPLKFHIPLSCIASIN